MFPNLPQITFRRFIWAFVVILALAVVIAFLSTRAQGASRSEEALRAQLAAAQAEVAKLSADNKTRAAAAAQQTAVVRTAQHVNAVKAAQAVSDAQDAVVAAQDVAAKQQAANDRARAAVGAANAKTDALMRVSQHSDFAAYTTLITTIGGFLTLLVGLLWQGYTQARNHKWETEATAAHRKLEITRIGEVQQAAQSAYRESNTVNQKIASIGLKMADDTPLNDKPKTAETAAQRSVLLVDDDAAIVPLVRLATNRCGVMLDAAADGAKGLAALRSKTYDLVLLDLSLGTGVSGMDVLTAVKNQQSGVPVIILTSDGSSETFVRSLNTGALDVMVKPFAPDALATRIQCLFDAKEHTT